MVNKKLINKYYDKRASCQVLGTLLNEANRIQDKDNQLSEDDFPNGLHQIIFIVAYELSYQGMSQITLTDIENYLANTSPVNYKKVFDNNECVDWLNKIITDANSDNYEYYYQRIRKMSLLRSYLKQDISVKEILNVDETDPKLRQEQQEQFETMSVEDIVRHFEGKIQKIKNSFIQKDGSETRKVGEEAEKLFEVMQESPDYGLSLESGYLNTITRGMQRQKLFLETRDSGQGKSRVAIKRLLNVTAPYLWDYEKKDFIPNRCRCNEGALYIGTEMDLYVEIDPMAWAFVSGVPESKIRDADLTKEEEARVKKAIEILKDTPLYEERNPNFGVTYLWQIIEEYKKQYDIYCVMLDYIELNATLISEFSNGKKGMGIREDQVLLNLSTNLKNIAEDLDVFIMAFTQTTDEARREGIRDQRAVKGARSLPNKADVGMVTFEPTKKELDKLNLISKSVGLGVHKYPNICYSLYKNRGGLQEYKDIKVWGYQDLGTMHYTDMYCTDKDYKLLNVSPTTIQFTNDKISIS